MPNFGYQIWFKDEETSAKIDEVLEQFITVSFSPTLRAKLRKAGKEIPQMAVEGNGMEKRVDEMIRVKRAGKAPPVPQDPVRGNFYALSALPVSPRPAVATSRKPVRS